MSSERRLAQRAPAASPGPRPATRPWVRAGAGAALVWLGLAAVGGPVNAGDVPRATRVVAWRELHAGMSRRWFPAVTFDPLRRHLLVFGGNDHVGDRNDTWAWDGVGWTRLATTGPSPRRHAGLAWDSTRSVAVLVGGDNGIDTFGDTWLWDGSSWTDAHQPHGILGDVAEDPVRGVLVGTGLIGTYEWDGSQWSLRTHPGPGLLPNNMSLGWDGNRGVVLGFGGINRPSGVPSGDTWAYDGTWQVVASSGPRPRVDAAMAWDPVRSRLVMHGGNTESGPSGDVWEWDGSRWSKALYFGGPAARHGHRMAWDGERGEVVAFGQCAYCNGSGGVDEQIPTVWSWNGVRFSAGTEGRTPTGLSHGTTSAAGTLLVLDLGFDVASSDLWRLDGTGWAPVVGGRDGQARLNGALAWDGRADRLVAYGGERIGFPLAQGGRTWSEQAGWQDFSASPQPPARLEGAMVWDSQRERLVLFGGEGAAGVALGDTWEWDGAAWQERVASPAPTARARAGMVFDAARGVTVLHGGTDGAAVFGDTWEWDGATWREVVLDPRPAPVSASPLAWDAFRRRVILYGSDGTWSYDGTAWEQLIPELSLGRRSGPVVAYSSEVGGVVLHGGSTRFSTQRLTDTWVLDYKAEPCTTGAQCQSGHCVDGVCCETASCGTCAACNLEASPGRCAPLPSGYRDPDTCAVSAGLSLTPVGVCNGAGACLGSLGFRCQADAECESGHCTDGVCCSVASCGSGADAECQSCRGDGLPGVCTAVTASTNPGRCEGTRACDTDAVCRLNTGEPCAADDECLTGRCVQGACRGEAEALCDGEATVLLASGATVDCVPYRCAAGACVAACTSTADCAGGFRCNAGGQCVASVPTPGQAGSCSTRGPTPSSRPLLAGLLLAVLAFARRARRWAAPLGVALAVVLGAPPARAQAPVTWTTLEPDLGFSVGSLTWDRTRSVVVRSPWRGMSVTSKTLEWTLATGWQLRDEVTGPDSQHGAAFHPPTGKVVVFGGLDTATQVSGDTWLWDGTAWERARPPLAPTARFNAGMAWDGTHVVLSGGLNAVGSDLADTWLWDGTTWTSGPPAAMGINSGHTMVWDPANQRVVAFGGRDLGTWQWDGTAWSQVASAAESPPTRYFAAMACDEARGVIVMTGGNRDGYDFDDTWELDGSTWTPVVTPETWGRGGVAIVWAGDLGRVVATRQTASLEVHSYDGTTWRREPGPRPFELGSPRVARDAARGNVVVFGGSTGDRTSDETWLLDGARRWTRVEGPGPPKRGGGVMGFDATRQQIVLWGGVDLPLEYDDTWLFDGTAWTEVTGLTERPPIRADAAFAHFRDRMVLFGGEKLGPIFSDQWEWDGSAWHEVTPTVRPAPRLGASMVWDQERDQLILFGGTDGAQLFADTWAWDGQAWTELSPPASPPGRYNAAAVWDPVRRRVLLVNGGSPTESFTDPVWSWDGTTWTHHPGVPGERPRLDGGVVFDPDTRSLLVLRGRASLTSDRIFSDLVEGQIHGEPCADGSSCHSGHCVDGVCCASDTCGTCESCALPGSVGQCAPSARGQPDDTCEFGLCDGAGLCLAPLGQPCADTADCLEGTCVDAVCCASARCEGECRSCATPGSSGVCSAVREADDDSCSGTLTCDADARCRTRLAGACTADADCGSDRCVLGVCRLPDEAVCLGTEVDRGTLGRLDCGAYTCEAEGQCRVACRSTADCAPGNACTAAGRCQEARSVEVVSESGCASAPGSRSSAGWLALAAAALVAARRRR